MAHHPWLSFDAPAFDAQSHQTTACYNVTSMLQQQQSAMMLQSILLLTLLSWLSWKGKMYGMSQISRMRFVPVTGFLSVKHAHCV